MKTISSAFKKVFKDWLYVVLAVSLSLNLLLLYYLVFLQTTTLSLFFSTTNAAYAWSAIVLTIIIALSFGISVALLIYRWKEIEGTSSVGGKDLLGGLVGAFSVGCPVCGSLLLPALGIAGGLSILPFQGIELKLASLVLFGLSLYESSKHIHERVCKQEDHAVRFEKGELVLNINRQTVASYLVPVLVILFVISLPFWPSQYRFNLAKKGDNLAQQPQTSSTANNGSLGSAQTIYDQINPPQGYELNTTFGNVGPKLLQNGAIDLEKFKKIYEQAGQSLTPDELKILTDGSNDKIKITPQNSYFLLNFFWAFGLANKNSILDSGPMVKYGQGQIGNFASTGGWTLGAKPATELYSKFPIVTLTAPQQKVLEDFAFNSYRPCCSNPTGFPDCNHGMAALGLGELMAAQGATADEIFQAFKYFNAFWFSQTYFEIAQYFKAKEGKDWKDVDSRLVAGKDYSTPQGAERVHNWLKSNNILQEPPKSGGGGCGV